MCGTTVADIVRGKRDLTGAKILCVYAKVDGRYAVYRTPQRVMIQNADDQDLGAEQRAALAPLNPLRGQINGLIDGWRQNSNENVAAKAALFDRRVADALVLGLQGHVDHAELHLREIKADVLEERTSPARVNYIVVAAVTALAVILIAAIATSLFSFWHAYSPGASRLWLGAGAGALGALFSTGIAMRTRAILTDLQPAENRADAVVRIGIGAMAGTVLVGLIVTGDVSLTLGDTRVPGPTETDGWIAMAVAGFAAGFLERLVPGLLEGAAIAGRARNATNPLAGGLPASAVGAGRRPPGVSERHPLGRDVSAGRTDRPAESPPATGESEPAPAEARLPEVGPSAGEASNGSRLPVV